MFIHRVRMVVKIGERADFVGRFKDVNALNPGVGLPTYRLYAPHFGDLHELWAEAEYPGLDAHVEMIEKARENPEWRAAFAAMNSHVLSGTVRDHPLEPVDLG